VTELSEVLEQLQETKPRRFRPYPDYKDSGVEWPRQVPIDWKIRRLKYASRIKAGQSPPSDIVYEGTAGLPFLQGNAEFGPVFPTPSLVCDGALKKAHAEDILLSVRAPVGAINIANQAYGIGRGLCAIQSCLDLDRSFSYYLLLAVRSLLDQAAKGSTYDAVTAGDVGNLPAILPHIKEQYSIAAFLDRETAKIDTLVAKKERLIELLREKRTALITRAVTKGLDPNAPMKDSGVKWLGKIPTHWQVKRLKFAARIEAGQSPSSDIVYEGTDGLPFLQGNAEFGPVFPTPSLICNEAPKKAHAEDILLSVRAPVGAINIANQAYGIGRGLCAIQSGPDLDRSFSYYLLLSVRSRLDQVAKGSTYDAVTAGDVGNLPSILPHIKEQYAITAFLDRETAKIDALIVKIRKAIDRLKEYRTAFISAAVTGKIDVRKEVE